MSDPPKDRLEFWIRFGCAVIFFGVIFFLLGIRFVDETGMIVAISVWAACTVAISLYAALHGDEAWVSLIRMFRWW